MNILSLSTRICITVQTHVHIQILGPATMQTVNNFLGEMTEEIYLQFNCKTFNLQLLVIYIHVPDFTKLHYVYDQSNSASRPRNPREFMIKKFKMWDLAGLSSVSANILIETRFLFVKKLEALKNHFYGQNRQLLGTPT